ncbi:MAG: hypothetical protein EOO38_31360, partial [Cytophagaceae bacterium]
MLAALPDRESWASTYLSKDTDLQDSEEEAQPGSPRALASGNVSIAADDASERIANFLMGLDPKVRDQYVQSTAVQSSWKIRSLTKYLRANLPGLRTFEIDDFLHITGPSALEATLGQPRQRPRVPWNPADLLKLIREAHLRESLSVHLSLSQFARFIDELHPDRVLRFEA